MMKWLERSDLRDFNVNPVVKFKTVSAMGASLFSHWLKMQKFLSPIIQSSCLKQFAEIEGGWYYNDLQLSSLYIVCIMMTK